MQVVVAAAAAAVAVEGTEQEEGAVVEGSLFHYLGAHDLLLVHNEILAWESQKKLFQAAVAEFLCPLFHP